MADIIFNQATGDSYEFLQTDAGTGGRMSEFIMTLAPKASWAKFPRHFHPYQTETFKVIEGELNLTAGKDHHVLKPGDEKVVVEPFTAHSFWNERNEPVRFIAEIYPPRNIERGFRLNCQLAAAGRVNERNIPTNLFETLILMEWFDSYFTFLPWKFQRLMFKGGAALAHLLGYGRG